MKKFLQSRKHLACMLKAVTLLTFAGVLFAGLVPIPQLVHYVARFYPDIGASGTDAAGPGRGGAVLCPVGADFAGGGNEGRSRPDHLRRRPC